jgi:hypothetical protein
MAFDRKACRRKFCLRRAISPLPTPRLQFKNRPGRFTDQFPKTSVPSVPCLFQHRDWSSRINPAVPLIYSPRPSVSSVRCPSSDTQRGEQGSAWPLRRWNPRKILCVLRVLRVLRAKSPLPTLSPECRDRRGRCTDAPMDPQTSCVWWFSSPAKGEILPRQSACCLLSCLPGCYVLEARANTC